MDYCDSWWISWEFAGTAGNKCDTPRHSPAPDLLTQEAEKSACIPGRHDWKINLRARKNRGREKFTHLDGWKRPLWGASEREENGRSGKKKYSERKVGRNLEGKWKCCNFDVGLRKLTQHRSTHIYYIYYIISMSAGPNWAHCMWLFRLWPPTIIINTF